MFSQSRNTKVLAAGLLSIVVLAVVLQVLGNNPPSAGTFSLSEYYQLAPIEDVISYDISRISRQWDSIEISYTSSKPIVSNKEFSQSCLSNYDVFNCHFVVLNGVIGGNGQIQPTEEWQQQLSAIPGRIQFGSKETIHISVIADGEITYPTDFQAKRTEALVEGLSRKLDIRSESIYYPGNWR